MITITILAIDQERFGQLYVSKINAAIKLKSNR